MLSKIQNRFLYEGEDGGGSGGSPIPTPTANLAGKIVLSSSDYTALVSKAANVDSLTKELENKSGIIADLDKKYKETVTNFEATQSTAKAYEDYFTSETEKLLGGLKDEEKANIAPLIDGRNGLDRYKVLQHALSILKTNKPAEGQGGVKITNPGVGGEVGEGNKSKMKPSDMANVSWDSILNRNKK